ncbi:dTDP-4-dehydrorhamnose 3,5-epimerase [Massilia phyllosphaerae]|uniref:dTDP-4-dehydrorhamnose 3,5-epimerase n=1 Tax=Massilia phyllosphaerae TaxID=3106034 RepID=UPI002B1CE018|nr:dTDP-4-dehydrorhamnose 3,5-epimerase [Massilia sp. SGZ-792]
MFTLKPSAIPGCHEVLPRIMHDARGSFVKVFHADAFRELGLETAFTEEYYSHSHKGVIRGMHFQTPPADHVKMVYCVQGEVFDVVLDLRVGSPTYGQATTFTLSAEAGNYLYIPKGLAHGFCAVSDTATLVYKVSTVYAPENDAGVLWSSVGVDWPVDAPILSDRDARFSPFSEFESPFTYE